MMEWIRFPHDLLFNPVLMQAAEDGAEQLILLPWLLVWAGRVDDNGRLSAGPVALSAEVMARGIPGATADDVAQCIVELLACGFLEIRRGVPAFVNWERYAGGWESRGHRSPKPSDSPELTRERQRRHREKKRLAVGYEPDGGTVPDLLTRQPFEVD